jgi:hypothetical protein
MDVAERSEENSEDGEDEEEYEVEKLLRKRVQGGVTQYEVKWAGYEDTTFEDAEGLPSDFVADFETQQQSKQQPKPKAVAGAVKAVKAAMKKQQQSVKGVVARGAGRAAGDEFVVDKVVDKRMKGGVEEYKVRWKGYDKADDNWQPMERVPLAHLKLFEDEKTRARTSTGAGGRGLRIGEALTDGQLEAFVSFFASPKEKTLRTYAENVKEILANPGKIFGQMGGCPLADPSVLQAVKSSAQDRNGFFSAALRKWLVFEAQQGPAATTSKSRAPTKSAPIAMDVASVEAEQSKSGSSGEEEAEDEYVVEAICGSRTRNGVRQFEIKWEGFPSSDNTWEPEENLSHSADKLVDFKAAKEKKSTGLPVKKVIAKKKRFFFGAGVR